MPLCPECGREVTKTDTHCMECGTDLLAAREKERAELRDQSVSARTGGGRTVVPANPAAAGMKVAGEKSSDETRIRAFDKQEAERLAQERTSAWVTSGLALIVEAVLVLLALGRIKAGGGFGEIVPALKPVALRNGGLFAPVVVGLMMLGSGVSGLLVGIGQIRLALAATRAINDVRANRKPEIAQVSTFTLLGLFLLCIFCPPIGFIVGLIMKFGRNPDLKGLGGNMVMVSIALMVLLGVNMVWKVFENMKPASGPKAGSGG